MSNKLTFIKKPIVVWLVALLLCLTFNYGNFMRHSKRREQPYITGWDNNLYFAWTRSLVHDGDVDFANDFAFLAGWEGGGATQEAFIELLESGSRTPTGRIPNTTGCGFGLAAIPLALIARGMSAIYSFITGIRVSPFAAIYCVAFIFTSILISFAGIAITFIILRTRFGRGPAFRAMVIGVVGLSTGYYIWFEPTMSQAPVFGFSALFVWAMLWWNTALEAPQVNARSVFLRAFVMGIMLGICCLTHFTAMAWGIAPVILGAYFVRDSIKRARSESANKSDELTENKTSAAWVTLLGGSMAIMGVGTFISFLPQFFVWKAIYGSWFVNTYEVTVHFRLIDVWNVFFDSRIGLFLWTPLAAAAVAGLITGAWRGDRLCIAGCGVFLFFLWEFSSCSLFINGNQGHAFGMRYFVDGAFLFFLGFTVFFRWIGSLQRRSTARRGAIAVVCVLVVWNLYFITAYRADIQTHGEPIQFRRLFTNGSDWIRQAKRDINLPKRFRRLKYPLFTPLKSDPDNATK